MTDFIDHVEGIAARARAEADIVRESVGGVIECGDVLDALTRAIELSEVFLVDGAVGPLPDRLRLYAAAKDARSRLGTVAGRLGDDIVGDLVEPFPVDGRVWRVGRERKITGWRKDEVRSEINRRVQAPKLDPETGEQREPTMPEVLERVWLLAEPATGRTGALAEVGITPDEYAQVHWSDVVEEVK